MSDIREFVIATVAQERLAIIDLVKNLSPKQLAWAPSDESNSVGFLLFHTIRTEDSYGHVRLGPLPQVWERDSWDIRWKIPKAPPNASIGWTTGNSWGVKELAAFNVPPLHELLAYSQSVRESIDNLIRTVDPAKLDMSVDPAAAYHTRGRVFRTLITHEAEHHGQIEMLVTYMKSA